MKRSRRLEGNRWLRRLAFCTVVAVITASAVPAQDNQNEKRGFDAESLYSVGEIDTVNLFNAGLSIVIPIGQRYPLGADTSYGLQLVYNSKLWDYRTELVEPPSEFRRIAIPTRIANAGLGWTLNPGYLLEENNSSEVPHEWSHAQYVGPDGSQHFFYDQLHEGENDGDPDVWYSRDNTYLRLTKVSTSLYRIEFPSGEIHEFGHLLFDASTQWRKWLLTRIEDRHGNWMTIDYGPQTSTSWMWTIADQHDRDHAVTLTYFSDVDDYYVTSVDLEAFGGGRATYTFTYEADSIEQGCGAEIPMIPLDVRLLTALELPEGETYDMTENDPSDDDDHRYWTFCGGGSQESGAIQGLRLPTRGQIEWNYAEFDLPQYFEHGSNAAPATVRVRGVRQRRTLDEAGNVLGRWNYVRELIPPPPYNPNALRGREQRVHVEDPLGHCTTHYFDANPGYTEPTEDSNPYPGWSYSLPFSWEEPQSSGHHLSTRVWDGTDEFLHCGGNLLRSTYVRYGHDELGPLPIVPFTGPLFDVWHETNRRVTSRRTVYHDDGDRFAETASSDFDGLGHYRVTTTGGNFDAGNTRTETTGFNPDRGTYTVDQDTNTSTGTFTPPSTGASWILNTFDRQTVTEGGTAVATACFDVDGFLTRRRTFAGTTEGADDVIAVFAPDADGNVTSERTYGGDLQTVATGPDLCAVALPSAPAYEVEHQYASGVRRQSRYLDGSVPMPFKSLDLDIDPGTGLVATSRDTSGIETVFLYDTEGRLTDERLEPGHGAWVSYAYVDATPTSQTRVEIEHQPNGGGAPLVESQVVFDGLGRVFQEKNELPSGNFGVREILYNDRGDRASMSEIELGNPSNRTEYLEYDPFGRPGRIRPPDGAAHDVTIAYAGVRRIDRTSQVATGAGGVETPATTTEIYDRQSRRYRVIEPGTGTVTTYGYDEGGRLSSVAMAGPVTQTRSFDYDGMGFLRSETHPEVGVAGNGSVIYDDYDAMGNAGRMADDRRTLDYAYDAAGRLLSVSSTAEGVVKQLIYDTASTRGLGKLHRAIRHNRLDIPGDGTANPIDVVVTETYDYAGTGGRVSSVLTANTFNDLDFLMSLTYDPLGRLEDLTYPICQGSAECPSDPLTVRNTYQADYLVAVGTPFDPDAGVAIVYHPNGLWSTLTHSNGVTVSQANDPDSMRRPARISVGGVSIGDPFDTGTYAYDGSGNIWAMGADRFEYDPLGRLTRADVHDWLQDFVYDAFGNLTFVQTTPPESVPSPLDLAVVPATNRLAGHGYDGSGNLTQFPGVWTQSYDPMNMAILRDPAPDASQWAAIYTADDERLATWDGSAGEIVQHWTLRSPSGQILRDFRYGPSGLGESIFCDGFESGDTSEWNSTTGFTGQSSGAKRAPSCLGEPEWTVQTSYAYREGVLLADYNAGEVRHYHLDHLGSVRQITNEKAEVVASYDYLPYGKEVESRSAALQFTGHERDSHLAGDADDLDYMHARYYSPHLSRFTSIDPVLGDPAMPQSWNRYGYALNSPINYTDPTGQIVVTDSNGLALIKEALHEIGAGNAATALGLTEQDGKTLLTARAGVNLLQSSDPLVQMIGDAMNSDAEISFEVTDEDLSDHSGAVTDALGFTVSKKISIKINPAQVSKAKVPGFWPNTRGIDVSPRAAAFHEFGHAHGNHKLGIKPRRRMGGLPGPTDDIAVRKENIYRRRLGLPLRSEH